jgi:hypothetical protein
MNNIFFVSAELQGYTTIARSDRTMFKARTLPKGAVPKITNVASVKGIDGTRVLNQEVMLTELVFPEFSPTLKKVLGPVRATVFHNKELATISLSEWMS